MEVDSDGEYDDLILDFDDPSLMDLLDNPQQQTHSNSPHNYITNHHTHPPHLLVQIEPLAPSLPQPTPLSPPPASTSAPSLPPPPILPPARPANLYDQFRRRRGFGSLSVSDLVAPSWCEVQHAYRLLSHAHLPPAQRPQAITTATGAVVAVSMASMVVRDEILKGGTATHARIEKAVMGDVEAVEVEVAGKEEVWALKVVNLVVLLEMLLREGRVREVPVWGLVGDKLVLGVIDEVERRELPVDDIVSSTTAPAPPAPLTPPLQEEVASAETGLSPEEEEALREILMEQEDAWTTPTPPPPPPTRSGFLLSDTKTRHSRSLPPAADSRSAKLQLMLYHRLLAGILTPPQQPPPVDEPLSNQTASSPTARSSPPVSPTARLAAHLDLALAAPLSDAFLASLAPLLSGTALALLGGATTLTGFFAALGRMGGLLVGGGALHGRLEISYVLRRAGEKWGKRKGGKDGRRRKGVSSAEVVAKGAAGGGSAGTEEGGAAAPAQPNGAALGPGVSGTESTNMLERELDHAPTGDPTPSPRRSKRLKQSSPVAEPPTTAPPDTAPPLPNPPQADPLSSLANDSIIHSASAQAPAPPPPTPGSEAPPATDPDFIGTEAFAMDDALLDAWLDNVMSLWMGERAPQGVSLEQTTRCRGCEFNEDCEWLAAKAEEVRREKEGERRAREARA